MTCFQKVEGQDLNEVLTIDVPSLITFQGLKGTATIYLGGTRIGSLSVTNNTFEVKYAGEYTIKMPAGSCAVATICTYSQVSPILPESDFSFFCDTETNAPIYAIYDSGTEALQFFNLDGSTFDGTPGKCETQITSDIIPWCIDGIDFNQHIILDQGVPVDTIWTDNDGAVVDDPRSGAEEVNKGICACVIGTTLGVITDLSLL